MNNNQKVKNKLKKKSILQKKNNGNTESTAGCAFRLKSARDLLKLNQVSFAQQLGFRNSYICGLEAGEKQFSKNVLLRLAEVFNISPNWILLGKGPLFLTDNPKEIHGSHLKIRQDPELENLVWHYLNSPMVKHSLLGYFFKLVRRNKTIIDEDIEIHRSQTTGEQRKTNHNR